MLKQVVSADRAYFIVLRLILHLILFLYIGDAPVTHPPMIDYSLIIFLFSVSDCRVSVKHAPTRNLIGQGIEFSR